MMKNEREKERRREYAFEIACQLAVYTKSIMIIGSVAYSNSVRENSDLEILSIVDVDKINTKTSPDYLCQDTNHIRDKNIDIWHTSLLTNDYPTKLIFWTDEFFDKITHDLNTPHGKRLVKEFPKRKVILHNFDGQLKEYSYSPIDIDEVKIIDYPVHIFDRGVYWAGVPVENLLSEPIIIQDDSLYVNTKIDSLIKALLEEACKEGKGFELRNLLLRKDRFSPETNEKLERRIQRVKTKLLL